MWLIYFVFIVAGIFCFWQGIGIRKRLKKTRYWKILPKGTIFYGYSFPFVLFLFSIKSWGEPSFVIIFALAVILFIRLVFGLNRYLKTNPLGEMPEILPDDVRKDVIKFCAMTPFITTFAFALVLYLIALWSHLTD